MKILVINGPNLNMLGSREPSVYGVKTLSDIEEMVRKEAELLDISVEFFQSNHEGAIIDTIQLAAGKYDALIINPGAFTHYSYAIRDAIKASCVKTIEIHISNIHAREEFRSKSVVSPVCIGQIIGFGPAGYLLALRACKTL